MMTERKLGVEKDVDHLRHCACRHLLHEFRAALPSSEMSAAVAMHIIDDRITPRRRLSITRRQHHTSLYHDRPAPEFCQRWTLEVDELDGVRVGDCLRRHALRQRQ